MMSHNPKKFYFDLMIYHIGASVRLRVQNLLGTEKNQMIHNLLSLMSHFSETSYYVMQR